MMMMTHPGSHYLLCYAWAVLLCILVLCLLPSAADFDQCNVTVRMQDIESAVTPLSFTLPNIRRAERGHSVYCWFRFEAALAQYIGVDVKELNVGNYNDEAQKCEGGYLRISDDKVCSTDPEWFPPTTICGEYESGMVRVRRYTRSPSAFVEFHLDRYKTTKGYQFDVEFLDVGEDRSLPYGHLQRKDGRIEDTKCDWLVPVNDCAKSCRVTSPGFPGIYPPNSRCRYVLRNFDDSRVDLIMGGTNFRGKFDMKKANDCASSPDYVEVYDGASTISKLIGRFCGHNGAHIISSGPTLLLLFQSGNGTPPWDYSGFDVEVTYRWNDQHAGGQHVAGSLCDWIFNSRDGEDGDAHTPDHVLHDENTVCTYSVKADVSSYYTHLELVIYKLLDDCKEYFEIFDGDEAVDKICKNRLDMTRNIFEYNISDPDGKVVYHRADKQLSNPHHSWIYYTFMEKPYSPSIDISSSDTNKRAEPGEGETAEVKHHPNSSGSTTHAHSSRMTSFLLMLAVWLMSQKVT